MSDAVRIYDKIIFKKWLSSPDCGYWDSAAALSLFCCKCGTAEYKTQADVPPDNKVFCRECGINLNDEREGAFTIFGQRVYVEIPTVIQLTCYGVPNYPQLKIQVHEIVSVTPDTRNNTTLLFRQRKTSKGFRYSNRSDEDSINLCASIKDKVLTVTEVTQGNTTCYTVDPVNEPDWAMHTKLRFLRHSMNKDAKEVIQNYVTSWRHRIEKQVQKLYGPGIPSFFAYDGTRSTNEFRDYGILFTQMQNISWRLAMPEAPNFNAWSWQLLREQWLGCDTFYKNVMNNCLSGLNFIEALCKVAEVSNCKTRKKFLLTYPWDAGMFCAIRDITTNLDYQMRIANSIERLQHEYADDVWYIRGIYLLWTKASVWRFLQDTKIHRSVETTVRILENVTSAAIMKDIANLYCGLNDEYKTIFWSKKIKIAEYHDRLVKMTNDQKFPYETFEFRNVVPFNYELPYGQRIRRVENTKELGYIADILDNCVRSYRDNIKKHNCEIYAMYDKSGTPKICIEVHRTSITNYLVQAKGKKVRRSYQTPVREMDEQTQLYFSLWIKNFKLVIRTQDVKP